ncbi:hypothetical protein EK21DRAFT_109661 [Setomelanomma holmii]|uniref:Uncharacterized protein n=1 Tax=Setomelanomma holmii TaxID=210430 RepID=A0A9P4HFB0_9PLEO|nr:hypothetical protein EK21DRAFT_109661 [Setomelanomma holmii]
MLISTRLWDLPWVIEDDMNPIYELKAVLSALLVNVLSRVGWNPQRHPSLKEVTPVLHSGNRGSDALLHGSGQVWHRPDNVPTQSLHQDWFVYATAWQLSEPALYISVVPLEFHLLIVVMHSAIVIWSRRGSEAWNSVSELAALAYLSKPEGDQLESCGAGIMLQSSLLKRVRIVAVEEKGKQMVRLVFCEEGQARKKGEEVEMNRDYS